MIRLRIPTWATVALSAIAGLLSLLNVTTFGFSTPWQYLVTFGLTALAAIGIAPLTGPALQNALHISHALAITLTSLFTTAAAGILTLDIDHTAKGLLEAGLTLVAGVLFGPAGGTPTPAPPPAP